MTTYSPTEFEFATDVEYNGQDYHAEWYKDGEWRLYDFAGEEVPDTIHSDLLFRLEAMKAEAEAEEDGEPDQYWPYIG